MIFDKSLSELTQIYQVIETIDLSSLDSKELYNKFSNLYKLEYQPTERIVVTHNTDNYPFRDLAGQKLTQLIEYINRIDIPHFVITIVTTNKNIKFELETLSAESVGSVCVDGEYIENAKYNRDSFCILPWMHLYVGTDGNILPCCEADHRFPLGNINADSIQNIMNSSLAQQIRSNMLAGVSCKECVNCYTNEDNNIDSARQQANSFNRQYLHLAKSNIIDIANYTPYTMDIRINNICNLKCRMCDGYFSSSIAQEEFELFNKTYTGRFLTQKQKNQVLDKIMHYLPNVESIFFAGGEPLIIEEHYKILDRLIELKKTNIEIVYSTNFTNLSFKNSSLLDMWGKFSNVTVEISADAIGKVAEYVRHGTKWNQLEKNLILLKEKCPAVNVKIKSCVSLLSVESLIELQKSWYQKGISIDSFFIDPVIGPDHLTLQVLPIDQKNRISKLINSHIDWINMSGGTHLANQWNKVLQFMMSNDASYHLKEFQRLTSIMDNKRNESFIEIFPQYKNLTKTHDI